LVSRQSLNGWQSKRLEQIANEITIEGKKKKFGVPPSGGMIAMRKLPPEGGTPNTRYSKQRFSSFEEYIFLKAIIWSAGFE
jgi:hypothetical protein